MLNTSNTTTALGPPWQAEPVAVIGPRDRTHLRITSVNTVEKYAIVEVYVGEVLHSSCYLHAEKLKGYKVKHAVRHPTHGSVVNAREIVKRLLSPKRFNAILGTHHVDGPIDMLRCGVAVGGATFFMREYDDGAIVAVFDDGCRQTLSPATVDDWNHLVDAWDAAEAGYGDARRVRIAEDFFRSRNWMPPGIRIFSNSAMGDD